MDDADSVRGRHLAAGPGTAVMADAVTPSQGTGDWFVILPAVGATGAAGQATIKKVTDAATAKQYHDGGTPQFTTQALAQAFADNYNHASSSGGPGVPAAAAPVLTDPSAGGAAATAITDIAGLQGIAKMIGDIGTFFGELFDINMWKSLGWIGLGGVLLVSGLALWLRKPIEGALGTVAGAALKAP